MPKIFCCSSTFNRGVVVTRIDKPGKEESIVHLDTNGKILFEKKYNDIINYFGMVNDREVIVLNVPESKIDIINLEKRSSFSLNHDYLFDDVAQMRIETFAETKLFCVRENGGHNDHRMRLTYYSYDGINPDAKPMAQWQSKDNEWTYDHQCVKGNSHSKICWWNYRHEAEIVFHYFDLRTDPNGQMQTVKCKNTIGNDYGLNNPLVGIGGLW